MSEQMTQFQKDFVRMLDSMREENKGETTCVGIGDKECEECLLTTFCDDNDVCFNAEKIIEVVTQWAKDHPSVTMRDKYKEVLGVEPKFGNNFACPRRVGFFDTECGEGRACEECKDEFWNSEYKEPKKEGE